jgi:hypothetical protein
MSLALHPGYKRRDFLEFRYGNARETALYRDIP